MPRIKELKAKRANNEKRGRTAGNMVAITVRIRKDRAEALDAAQAALEYPMSQGALLDRAIDLLVKDVRKKKEIE